MGALLPSFVVLVRSILFVALRAIPQAYHKVYTLAILRSV